MLALIVSGVVVFAVVILAAVAVFLGAVLLEDRSNAAARRPQFLDDLRRISSRRSD